MLDVVTDTVAGNTVAIVLGAEAWQHPSGGSFLERSKGVNRLLGTTNGSTHLLRVVGSDGETETWYAGRAGVGFAAGIENMAIRYDELRDAIVVVPLDTRIYWAQLNGALVQNEGAPYPTGFTERIDAWRSEGRTFVILNSEGRQAVELPNPIHLDIDFGFDVTYRLASSMMLRNGLVRWRDVTLIVVLIFFGSAGYAASSWVTSTHVEGLPIDTFVQPPAPPARYRAGIELGALAELSGNHDELLWSIRGAHTLTFDPEQFLATLRGNDGDEWQLETTLQTAEIEPVDVQPFTLDDILGPLQLLLDDFASTVIIGGPFDLGSDARAQRVTVTLDQEVVSRLTSLASHLRALPVQFHSATCSIERGVFDECTLEFSIREARAR